MSSDLTSDVSVMQINNDIIESIVKTIIKSFKKIFFFLIIYCIGYFGLSTVWLFGLMVLVGLSYKWKKEKRAKVRVARAIALGHEKEIILKTLQDLPPWVRFPDIENVEWLNKMFKQIWENMNRYIQDIILSRLEPIVKTHVPDFKFNKVVLGNVPLRVDGIEVYQQEAKHKIVMDLDISYAGDCYVTFQTFKFTGGIKNIQLRGKLRVVMTPLIFKLPIIGGLQVYFMNVPRIDFGLIKVTTILDIPVIRSKIQNTITNIINSRCLFPNMFTIKLGEGVNMSNLKIFKPEGILRVHVVEAKNLMNKDIIGKSDPYTVLSMGSRKIETPIVQNSLNPKWDFWGEFEAETNSDLKIQVWDHDDASKDELLGNARIGISQIAKKGQDDLWIKLQDVTQGTIHIRLTWLSLSANFSDLEAALKEATLLSSHLRTALLMVYLESSQNLPKPFGAPPNAYVILEVEQLRDKTDIIQQTCDPDWEKGFTFMIRDPRRAVLDVKITDYESGGEIGELSYKVDNLKSETNMEFRHHQFSLNPLNSGGSIFCCMTLRIFKNENLEESEDLKEDEANPELPTPRKIVTKRESVTSKISHNTDAESLYSEVCENGELILTPNAGLSMNQKNSGLGKVKLTLTYSMQRQKLIIDVHTVENIPCKNVSQIPSPYVKLHLLPDKHKSNKKKTKTVKDSCSPVYDERFEWLISSKDLSFARLMVVVATEKNFFDVRKKFLGQVVIDLGKYENLTKPLTAWFGLKRKNDTDVYYLR